MTTVDEGTVQAPKRRVLRLSVRALMVLVLLLAVGLGWLVQRARLQREAIVAIEKTGGKIYYDWQWPPRPPTGLGREPKAPKWLVDAIGADYFSDVVAVQLGPMASDAEMELVGRLPRITMFSAPGARGITDAGAAQLAGLNDLESVWLPNTKVTGAALKSLRDKTRLKTLSLNNLAVLDADLANIEGLTRLEVLDLSGTKVTDEGLAHLDRLVNLRDLRINSTEVTGSGFGHLKGMNKLLWLRMNETKVRDLSTLPPLPALWGLTLEGSAMDDAGLAKMPDLPSLAWMTLMRTSVTDEGLPRLLRYGKTLKALTLSGPKITDAAAPTIAKLDRVETLVLNGTKSTDATLDQLTSLTALKILDLDGTATTKAGLDRLKQSLPQVQTMKEAQAANLARMRTSSPPTKAAAGPPPGKSASGP